MPEVEAIVEIINKYGSPGLLALALVVLVRFMMTRMVPREMYDEARGDIDDVRMEMRELVGPALDQLTDLQKRQLTMQEEMWRHVESQSGALQELSKEIRVISHEMTMQRLNGPARARREAYDD